MAFTTGFSLVSEGEADVFLEGADFGDAVVEAEKLYGERVTVSFQGDLDEVVREGGESADPFAEGSYTPNATKTPSIALRHAGLRRIAYDDVMRLTIGDAHRALLPYFRVPAAKTGKLVRAYDTPAMMRRSFITTNYKMQKRIEGVAPGRSRGPCLLPHAKSKELSERRLPLKVHGLCSGSNAACRTACLVYSGNNPTADAAFPAKLSRTESLLLEPVAWLRMFVEAIGWHEEWCRKRHLVPYVRMNPLSDIPWELVMPELFEAFPGVTFYDYTKVAGREPGRRYDLTFSFSGTNRPLVRREIDRGHRVAVVFLLERPCGPYKKRCNRVDELTFMGQPVIDGDKHDFRPLDPPGSVVGLTFKRVHLGGKWQMKPPTASAKMVVPTIRDNDTGAFIVAATPAHLGGEMLFEEDRRLVAGQSETS